MREAGMSFASILASLTTVPARRLRADRRGRVMPGYIADLVVLGGDPTQSVRALCEVRATLRDGCLVYAAA
jgi:imidazolonepropionase-like amidohydrolase